MSRYVARTHAGLRAMREILTSSMKPVNSSLDAKAEPMRVAPPIGVGRLGPLIVESVSPFW